MLAFRSEAHAQRWCDERRIPVGECFTLDQAWRLGQAWYADKLSPEWKRASPEEAEETFAGIGLKSEFWRLV
jgi:Alkylmercury lyase